MSYCVHCGVELDATASFCPLCHTRVLDPGQPVDTVSPKPFPTRRGEVAPAAKQEVALLITAMLASVAVCCGVLNLFLRADRTWSLYVIGAAAMLWLWLVNTVLWWACGGCRRCWPGGCTCCCGCCWTSRRWPCTSI